MLRNKKVDKKAIHGYPLKQTYRENNAIEVGVCIRSPWTGKVLIDNVELLHVDPDHDLTAMEKYLGLRG
jgi:hypothetical protein